MDGNRDSNSSRRNAYKIRRKYRKKRRNERLLIRACIVLPFLVVLVGSGVFAASSIITHASTIYVETQNIEMYQDGGEPQFKTVVTVDGDLEYVLDKETGYTVADFVADLEAGNALSITCAVGDTYIDSDGYLEGSYAIDTSLVADYEAKLMEEWRGNVNVEIVDGSLEVKNKTGYWEGDVFTSWDGAVVSKQWVKVQGESYYLNEEGHKLTNTEYQEGITIYTFDENGIVTGTENCIDPDLPMLALTFDDGIGSYTMELLEALEEYDVRATFFMQGSNIQESEAEVLQKMVELGCEIGNHSTNHPDLATLSAAEIEEEMETTDALIYKYAGVLPTVMRPPYGSTDDEAEAVINYPIINWNVDTEDWKTDNSSDVLDEILSEASDGDIILMHDVKSWSVEAAIEAIPILLEEGYQLVTVSEMAEAKGIDLEDGEVYYMFP